MKRPRRSSTSSALLDGITRQSYVKYLSLVNSTYYLLTHDMRNPLRQITGFAELVRYDIEPVLTRLRQELKDSKGLWPDRLQDNIDKMLEGVERLDGMFSCYSRIHTQESHEEAELVASPYAAVTYIRQAFPSTPIAIAKRSPQSLLFLFPARVLTGILLELVRNSVSYGDSSTAVSISWTVAADAIAITVQDNNASPATILPRYYVSINEFRDAYGVDRRKSIGLSLIVDIMRGAGGFVLFSRSPRLGGVRTKVVIPVSQYAIHGRLVGKESSDVN